MRYILYFILSTILFASDANAPSQRTRDREIDIHHIKIDVSVDITSESVYGHVIHTLSPLSSSLNNFFLDAEDMTIRRVRFNGKDISFIQNNNKVYITLNKFINWNEKKRCSRS